MTIKKITDDIRDRIGWSYTRLSEEVGKSRQSVWTLLNRSTDDKTQVRSLVKLLDAMGWTIAVVPEDYDPKEKFGEDMFYEVTIE